MIFKRLFILIIACFFSNILAAAGFENLTITTNNDLFNGEVSINRDDYRTYGIGTSIEWTGGFFTDLFFYGLTDRKENQRCDLGEIKTGLSLEFEQGPVTLVLKPFIGGSFYGNLGGQYAQNIVHRMFSLKEVSFDYLSDSSSTGSSFSDRNAELLFGLDAICGAAYSLRNSRSISPEMHAHFSYSVPSAFKTEFLFNLSLSTDWDNSLDFGAGWSGIFSEYPDRVLELSLSQEEGFYISGGISTGILKYENRLYPGSEYSSGSISLAFSGVPDSRERGKGKEFLLDYSLDFLYFLKGMRILFPLDMTSTVFTSIEKTRLRILVFADYTYGDAVNDFQSTEYQIRFSQILAGFDFGFGFFPSGIPLEFFAGFAAGCRNEKFWDLGENVESVYSPVFQPEAGLRTAALTLFPEGGLFDPNTRYGLSLRYGVQFITGNEIQVQMQHRFSLGLNLWSFF
ncbi:MAG: hypothetical protein JEY99_04605 [Spirochaetales bacterium]|nr:hypothetical protein [Spirochaetales bacterium]